MKLPDKISNDSDEIMEDATQETNTQNDKDEQEIEMDNSYDGQSEEFVHYGDHFTEEEQEALAEEYEDQLEDDDWMGRNEWLEERGFETLGCNWQIHGGVEAIESDHEVYG